MSIIVLHSQKYSFLCFLFCLSCAVTALFYFFYQATVHIFVATPVRCMETCHCYYSIQSKMNVMNCSTTNPSGLPNSLLPETDWFHMSGGNVSHLCHVPTHFQSLKRIVLKNNSIKSFCQPFVEALRKVHLDFLDLSGNNLTKLPRKFEEMHFINSLNLSNNNFVCSCDIIWMIDWINNFTTSKGERIVRDFKDVKCHTGQKVGTPIYLLDSTKLHCFPPEFAIWKIAVIATVGALLLLSSIVIVVVIKRSREVRWIIYKNLGKLIRAKHKPKVNHLEYDAFLSYRQVQIS